MLRFIPNLFTFLNMFSGLVALIFVIKNQYEWAAYFVFLGIFFDFFDGFFARLLKVQNDLGKQLDSLADMVTSGVVPGLLMYSLLISYSGFPSGLSFSWSSSVPFLGFILTMAAGYRLAKFNLDNRQKDKFIGVPTPTMSVFVMSIPLVVMHTQSGIVHTFFQSTSFLLGVIFIFSYLMNSSLELFSLKFKNFNFKKNQLKFYFSLSSIILLILFKSVAIPLLVLLYIGISIILHFVGFNKDTSYSKL